MMLARLVSSLVFLLVTVTQACPSFKVSGMKAVVGGKTAVYKVRVSIGSMALNNAILTIGLPNGVKFVSSTTLPKRGAPSQAVDGLLTWSALSLATHKHYSFRIRVVVNACAPDELEFTANVISGGCNVNAAGFTTRVKRAKRAAPCPPLISTASPTMNPTTSPTAGPQPGVCNITTFTANSVNVYSCGGFYTCGSSLGISLTTPEDCVDYCQSQYGPGFAYVNAPPPFTCMCQTIANYNTTGSTVSNSVSAYAIGQNPAVLIQCV